MPPSCHGDLHRLLQISGRPMCMVKLLQLVLNAPTCLVFNQQRQAQVSPLLTDWLLAAARIKLKPLLTLGLLAGSAPSDVSNLCTHSAPRRLAKSCVPTRPSKLFSYLVLQWWNNFLSSDSMLSEQGHPSLPLRKLSDTPLLRTPALLKALL